MPRVEAALRSGQRFGVTPQLSAVRDVELAHDPVHVALDRAHTQHESGGDLGVGESARGEAPHLLLAVGEGDSCRTEPREVVAPPRVTGTDLLLALDRALLSEVVRPRSEPGPREAAGRQRSAGEPAHV